MTATADRFFAAQPSGDLPEVPTDIPRHKGTKQPWIRNADDAGPPPAVTSYTHRDGSQIAALADPKDSKRGRYYGRASSFGSLLDDKYKIQLARQRRIVWAMGRHPELVMRAQAVVDLDRDRDELEAIADKANEYGKGDAASTKGTAFHRLRERRDQGEDLSYLDPLTLEGLAAWERLLAPFELVGSEQFVVNDALESAGTYDALLLARRTITIRHPKTGEVLGHVEAGESVVGDLKSGKWGPEWFGPTYGCQALVYAGGRPYSHTRGRYDWPGGQQPSQRWAVIPYVSLDRLDDAGLHWIDLDKARRAVAAVQEVKAIRADRLMFVAHSDEPMPADLAAAGQRAVSLAPETWRTCSLCNYDQHRCPGCGESTAHQYDNIASGCPACMTRLALEDRMEHDANLTNDAILAGLLDLIASARSRYELVKLKEQFEQSWTPESNAAAYARWAELPS